MLRRALGVTGFAVAIALVACSDDDGKGASPDAVCDDLANAFCKKFEECVPLFTRVVFPDLATCIARGKPQCVRDLTAPDSGATASSVAACAAAFRDATCDALFDAPPPACKTPAGTRADGAACGTDAQCVGRRCRIQESTCGACSARSPAGGACDRTDDCDEGLTCAQGKCVSEGKAGAACSAAQPCNEAFRCANGTCTIPLEEGAPCTPAGGDACNALKGLFCDPGSKVCKKVTFANPGESCGLVNGTFVGCAGGGSCKRAAGSPTGTCQAPAADGQPCDEANDLRCLQPARCINKVCTLPDPAACK